MPAADLIARELGATDAELGFVYPTVYRLFVRDAANNVLGELTDWMGFTCLLRHNGIGTWALTTSADSLEARLLAKTGGIIVTREVGGIERTIFSGRVSTEWAWTARTFSAAGRSDEELLEAPCRPSPSIISDPDDTAYVRQGVASSLLINLVSEQIGPYAHAPWLNASLLMGADPLIGSPTPLPTIRAYYDPIIVQLQGLANLFGLGFRMQQSDRLANHIEFTVYEPVDRSADAKFSLDAGTAQDYEDTWAAPAGNYGYVLLGDNLGGNRTVIEGGNADSIAEAGRIIPFVIDKRGVTDPVEGQQALQEALAASVSSRKAVIVPFDVPALQYGQDYDLGDLVTVSTQAGDMVDLIREIEITLDPQQGAIVRPLIGQAASTGDEPRDRYIAAVADRVAYLEANWNIPPDSVDRSMLAPVLKPPIGSVVPFAGTTTPAGWLLCQGQAVSRTTYAALFAVISTAYGAGDGSTTFGLPDARGRFLLGAGGSHALASTGGSETAAGPPHTHPGSHSHGIPHTHAGQAHTHPGSHSHGVGNISISHDHSVDIDHDHGSFNSGGTSIDSVGVGHASLGSGSTDHHHSVNPPALGTTNRTTSTPNNVSRSGSTDPDSNAPAASYSGSPSAASPASSDPDSNAFAASYPGTIATMPPFLTLNAMIYAGA